MMMMIVDDDGKRASMLCARLRKFLVKTYVSYIKTVDPTKHCVVLHYVAVLLPYFGTCVLLRAAACVPKKRSNFERTSFPSNSNDSSQKMMASLKSQSVGDEDVNQILLRKESGITKNVFR